MLCLGRKECASQSNVQQMKETQLSAGLSVEGLTFSLGFGRMCGYWGMNTSSLLFCDFFFYNFHRVFEESLLCPVESSFF